MARMRHLPGSARRERHRIGAEQRGQHQRVDLVHVGGQPRLPWRALATGRVRFLCQKPNRLPLHRKVARLDRPAAAPSSTPEERAAPHGACPAICLGAGGIQVVAPNVLATFRRDMLRELQQEPHHRKGLGLAFEEFALGGEGDCGGTFSSMPILFGDRGGRAVYWDRAPRA